MSRAQNYYKQALAHVLAGEFKAASAMLKAVRTSIKRAKCDFHGVGIEEYLFDNVSHVANRGIAKEFVKDISMDRRTHKDDAVRFGELLKAAAAIKRAGGLGDKLHQSGVATDVWNELVAGRNLDQTQRRMVDKLIQPPVVDQLTL